MIISWDLMGLCESICTLQLTTATKKGTADTVGAMEHVHAEILDKACIRREHVIQWDLNGFGLYTVMGPMGFIGTCDVIPSSNFIYG